MFSTLLRHTAKAVRYSYTLQHVTDHTHSCIMIQFLCP